MLSGNRIKEEVSNGRILIDKFHEEHVQPASYDVRLAGPVLVYCDDLLDAKKRNPTAVYAKHVDADEADEKRAVLLEPGVLYLARTQEIIGSDYYAMQIGGRSSYGRLGVCVHVTAGFIDPGFHGNVTLEITVVHTTRVYFGERIAQITFTPIEGEVTPYSGRYTGEASRGTVASKSWEVSK